MKEYSKLPTNNFADKKSILRDLAELRDQALTNPEMKEGSGVSYRLEQPNPPEDNPLQHKEDRQAFIKKHARERVNLHRQTALAILAAANISPGTKAYEEASRKLSTAQMKSPKGVDNVNKILRTALNQGREGKEKLSKKDVKSMLKAGEGIMMRRRVQVGQKLYSDGDEKTKCSTVVQRVSLDAKAKKVKTGTKESPIIMEAALSKGDQAKERPPRNLRSCDVTSNLGTNQYLISSYLLEGTKLDGLKALSESKAEAMRGLLNCEQNDLPNRVNYVTLIDSQDHNASWIINLFKGDNEIKLEKKAGKDDGPEIIRMNTTQKGSWGSISKQGNRGLFALGVVAAVATVALAATGVGALAIGLGALVAGGTLAYRTGLSVKTANPDLYKRANVVMDGLDKLSKQEVTSDVVDKFNKAFGAKATTKNVGQLIQSKSAELKYLTGQLKAIEKGQLNPGNRWKPVLEQMITARTGAVSLMGCKSGKDRAFGVTALTMAMEKRVADCIDESGHLNTTQLEGINLEKDSALANNLKEIYMSDYGPKVGADNCDGAYGTKDPQNFFPDGLMGALNPDDQSALKAFMEGSNKLAKLNGSVKFDPELSQGIENDNIVRTDVYVEGWPPATEREAVREVTGPRPEVELGTQLHESFSNKVGSELDRMSPESRHEEGFDLSVDNELSGPKSGP